MSGPGVNVGDEDRLADFDGDGGVDLHDLAGFATDGHQRANRTGTAPERRRALSEPPAPAEHEAAQIAAIGFELRQTLQVIEQ